MQRVKECQREKPRVSACAQGGKEERCSNFRRDGLKNNRGGKTKVGRGRALLTDVEKHDSIWNSLG